MTLPPLLAIGLIANQISLTVGMALLMLILWQSRRYTNLLFGAFLLAVMCNPAMFMIVRLSAFFDYLPTPWFLAGALAIGAYGVLMFVFTAEFTGKATSLARWGYVAGAVAWLVAFYMALTGRLMVNIRLSPAGETLFDFTPQGYAIVAVLFVFEGLALANLLIRPTERSRRLIPGVMLLIVSVLIDLVPAISRLPLNSILTAVSAMLLARVILQYQLFNPLAELNRELAKANRHKSRFLANMSHELRTPLNSIIGYTELVVEGVYGEINDRQSERLTRVLRNGRHLLQLINDILDLSKIEAGYMKLDCTEVHIAQVIDSAQATVRPLAAEKDLTLTVNVPEEPPILVADEARLNQMLTNLLGNAVKFTDEGGITIDVTINDAEGQMDIAVSDTGVGIAPDQQAAIFDEFQQADNTTTREYEGTGLGLAITQQFANMHGGDVTLTSEVGVGSTFTIHLPLTPDEAQTGAG